MNFKNSTLIYENSNRIIYNILKSKIIKMMVMIISVILCITNLNYNYAYNIRYQAEFVNLSEFKNPNVPAGIYNENNLPMFIYTFTNPHSSTINRFEASGASRGTWISSDIGTSGSSVTFKTHSMVFNGPGKGLANAANIIEGGAGDFNSRNPTYFYYDVPNGIVDKSFAQNLGMNLSGAIAGVNLELDFNNPKSHEATFGSDYTIWDLRQSSSNGFFRDSWTVNPAGMVLDKYSIPWNQVDEIRQKYLNFNSGMSIAEINTSLRDKGIKFSNSVNTKYNGITGNSLSAANMDAKTLSMYYGIVNNINAKPNVANGMGFSSRNFGLNTNNQYMPGFSNANLFDNILLIPFDPIMDGNTKVYINYYTSKGTRMDQVEISDPHQFKQLLNSTDEFKASSQGSRNDYYKYHESYSVSPSESLIVRPKSNIPYKGKEYRYVNYKIASVPPINNTEKELQMVINKVNSSTTPLNPASDIKITEQGKIYMINLYYGEIDEQDEFQDLDLIGKLAFINRRDGEYQNATTGLDMDYVPSGSQLTPYIAGAYPYVVRALNYQRTVEPTKRISAYARVYQEYNSQEWVYNYACTPQAPTLNDYLKDPLTGKVVKDLVTGLPKLKPGYTVLYDHSNCGWKSQDTSVKTEEKKYNFNCNYTQIHYELNNFKMYRIKDMTVWDDDVNVGGKLFNGGSPITIQTSQSYNNMFNRGVQSSDMVYNSISGDTHGNQSGITVSSKNVPMSGRIYHSTPKPNDLNTPSTQECGETSSVNSDNSARSDAQNKISPINEYNIWDKTGNITINYSYHNDYVSLDNRIDMVDKNYHSFSEIMKDKLNKGEFSRSGNNFNYNITLDSTKKGGKVTGSTIKYTDNLMSYMSNEHGSPPMPSGWLTDDSDFKENYLNVPVNRENGLRTLRGKISYELVGGKYNKGGNSFVATDYTYTITDYLTITVNSTKVGEKYFGRQMRTFEGPAEVNQVNVLTPMAFGEFKLDTQIIVDHTEEGFGKNDQTLQKDAEFTITPVMQGYAGFGYNYQNTSKFVAGYYYQFDFDVQYVSSTGAAYFKGNPIGSGAFIPARTTIFVEGGNSSLTAKTTTDFGYNSAHQYTNSLRVIAAAQNMTQALKDYFFNLSYNNNTYIDTGSVKINTSPSQNQKGLLTRGDIVQDANHAVHKNIVTKNVGRIFDFAVTDCNDLAFKDIFKETTGTNVNKNTEVAYYAGYRRLNLTSGLFNDMEDRPLSEIGTNIKTILPLGPYKHKDGKTIQAPKLGYRISFDLKTTGYINASNEDNNRTIEIKTSYYYLSKDGKVYDDNVEVYYKNGNGKYINFIGSGYKIYFKPNDGYRYLRNSTHTNDYSLMSTKLEALNIAPYRSNSATFILDNKMMSTSNTKFLQSWYGEYKLPNSTIIFSKDKNSSNNNINNPYRDGYIGVKFEIKAVDKKGSDLLYNTSDKDSNKPNTSQWDYEGYLGFKAPGNKVSAGNAVELKLEKGTLLIDTQEEYDNIKSTVVLYDLDNVAADDFQ